MALKLESLSMEKTHPSAKKRISKQKILSISLNEIFLKIKDDRIQIYFLKKLKYS